MSGNVDYMPENPVLHDLNELLHSVTIQTAVAGQLRQVSQVIHEKTVDATIIAMPTRGRYEVWHSDGHWIIKPGETFIVPSQTPVRIIHHTDRNGSMHAKWIHLHMTLHGTIDLLGLYNLPGRLTKKQSLPVSDAIDTLLALKSPSTESQRFSQLLLTHHVTSTLAYHLASLGHLSTHRIGQMQQSAQLVPVFEAIAQHLDKPITIDDLCRWAHLSPSRLHAIFCKVTGLPPMRYVMQARLTQARQQLVYTDKPISLIATSLSFASPFHFSRVFKTVVGVSPSDYRHQNALTHGM